MSRAQLTSTVEQNTGGAVAPVVAGKNKFINGDFNIWQRNTTVSYAASTASYSSDRWYFGTPANGASTVARYATSDTTNLPNIQYCARVQRNSGQTGTGYYGFDSSIETTNSVPYAGKTVTFSFYARAGALYSTASNNLYFQLVSGTGTDQSVTSGFTGATYPINTQAVLTTNWQRFTATGTIPTNSSQLGIRFLTNPVGTAGATDYFELTGVQIDLGTYNATTAPAFRRSGGTLQGELAACKRYLPSINNGEYYGYCYATNNYVIGAAFDVQARVQPTGITVIGTPTIYDSLNTSRSATVTYNSGSNVNTGSVIAAATGVAGAPGRMNLPSSTILFTGCEL